MKGELPVLHFSSDLPLSDAILHSSEDKTCILWGSHVNFVVRRQYHANAIKIREAIEALAEVAIENLISQLYDQVVYT
ncbi:hypothetical protein G9P44_003817 [Scheffersomyces stipitis]|nr:hypothetical protein G9P44_003817 [Scheffersomyces stipitis]